MFVFKAAVVGGGTIGGEIAHVIADSGIPVVLRDAEPRSLDEGIEAARSLWQARVNAGKLDPAELERRLGLISATTGYEQFGDVDFVIEAGPERLDIKQALFAELDELTPGRAILASTSALLSITEIGELTGRPDRILGFHFSEPASATRLVEVVEGDFTSAEVVQAAINFAQAIRKTPIRCGESPGLVVNRIVEAGRSESGEPVERSELATLVESCLVIEEGVSSPREIDLAMMLGAGVSPPPLAQADRQGLDVVLRRLEQAEEDWGERFAPPTILRRLVAQGRLGVATGQGVFPYPRPDTGWGESPVKLETRGEIGLAWLDRPPANSISPEMVEALHAVWQAARGEGVRALVFLSANPMLFCAGADIKAFTKMDEAAGRALLEGMHGLLREMECSSTVTIAAVNALAFGGGCELAMACDFRIAAESASFGQPEINLGIVPGFGGTQRLGRLVGYGKALEMNLTGEPIGSFEALEAGLVNRVVEDHELLDTALAWARKLAAQAPVAVGEIKRASTSADFDAGIEAEKRAFAEAFASADAREGIEAFVQKRTARFQGR